MSRPVSPWWLWPSRRAIPPRLVVDAQRSPERGGAALLVASATEGCTTWVSLIGTLIMRPRLAGVAIVGVVLSTAAAALAGDPSAAQS